MRQKETNYEPSIQQEATLKMNKPLFAFFGTPHIATIVLDQLEAHGLLPALVVTAPDRESGRGLERKPSPVKVWALKRGIDVLTPQKVSDEAFVAELANTNWDVFVVSMYAKIIPREVLELPRHGCLNVHPSLLPKLRGPSPVLSAILCDLRETGVTIMLLNENLDEGPILAQAKVVLDSEAWPPKGSEFEQFLAREGGNLLAEVLPLWLDGKVTQESQDHTKATYTKKFTDEDAHIDLAGDERTNFLKIRAFDLSPSPYFITRSGKRVLIKEAVWKDGHMFITRVTPEGKKEMDYEAFSRGQKEV